MYLKPGCLLSAKKTADAESWAVEASCSQDQKGKEQAATPGSDRPHAGSSAPRVRGAAPGRWGSWDLPGSWPGLGWWPEGASGSRPQCVAARPGLWVEQKEQSRLGGCPGLRPGLGDGEQGGRGAGSVPCF